MTRARVLRMAESLGYRPNLAARYLKSRKQLRISVHLPRRDRAVLGLAARRHPRGGGAVRADAARRRSATYPRLGEGDIPLFEQALADGTNGLIIAPGDPAALRPGPSQGGAEEHPGRLRRHRRARHPAPDCRSPPIPSRSAPSAASSSAASLPGGGPVAFFTGWLGTQDHADKLRGFESSLSRRAARDWRSARWSKRTTTSARGIAGAEPAEGASGPGGHLRQHGELAAGAARRRRGRPPRRTEDRHDRPVPGAGRLDPRRQGGGDGLPAAAEPGPARAAGAVPVSRRPHRPAGRASRSCRTS